MTENKVLSVAICKDTLEVAAGKQGGYVPKQVLESTLHYLKEYEQLKSKEQRNEN